MSIFAYDLLSKNCKMDMGKEYEVVPSQMKQTNFQKFCHIFLANDFTGHNQYNNITRKFLHTYSCLNKQVRAPNTNSFTDSFQICITKLLSLVLISILVFRLN